MISLKDIINLKLPNFEFNDCKVHTAYNRSGNSALDAFLGGNFQDWQKWQRKRDFNKKFVISLIGMSSNKWLYAGVYEVLGEPKKKEDKEGLWYEYPMKLLEGQDDHIGRIVISYKKEFRNAVVYPETIMNDLQVSEVLEEKLSLEDFPGFRNVMISYQKLKTIIEKEDKRWKAALATVRGIYLITDIKEGKHYVGKASGEEAIWQRWAAYANDGHGGNKKLRLKLKGNQEHTQHFQYSILEIFDNYASENDINSRESHWKEVLKSREFGYNDN